MLSFTKGMKALGKGMWGVCAPIAPSHGLPLPSLCPHEMHAANATDSMGGPGADISLTATRRAYCTWRAERSFLTGQGLPKSMPHLSEVTPSWPSHCEWDGAYVTDLQCGASSAPELVQDHMCSNRHRISPAVEYATGHNRPFVNVPHQGGALICLQAIICASRDLGDHHRQQPSRR